MSQNQPSLASEPRTTPIGAVSCWTVLGICVFLALIVWIVFGQTTRFEFVDFDDGKYVYRDPVVTHGLTSQGIAQAFSARHSDNWVPLTTLSHMLDCQLFGPNAGYHHLVNVLLQAAAAILLFLALRQMTGSLWRSAFVAAVFAIHPLRVESVAWVSERKDVLSGVFFMLTLLAYVRYTRSAKPISWYVAALFFFILGLLSKPSVVTLPCVLLLLDYWPLNRFNAVTIKRLILEKIPFLLLSFACCIFTVISEKTSAIKTFESYPLPLRIENAIVSYIIQIERIFYPIKLAVFYPYPRDGIPWWEVALCVILLMGICAVAWAQRRTRPWLLVGWLWYLGILLPNIGFIQIGGYARADRYTYLPQIGLYLLLTWMVAEWCLTWRHRRVALSSCSAVILLALIFCAHAQTGYWRNSESLWTHALDSTSGNFVAHNNYGDLLMKRGDVDAAIEHYRASANLHPDADAYHNLGNALLAKGDTEEAYSDFQMVLKLQPDSAAGYSDLGDVYLSQGKIDLAIQSLQKALQLNPTSPMACYHLGNAYMQNRQMDQAIRYWQQAVDLRPDFSPAHNNLGNACMLQGHIAEAIQHWQAALKSQPDLFSTQMNLAWVLAACPDSSLRNGAEALALAQRANLLSDGQNPMVLRTLAAACAENGNFPDAIIAAQQALQITGSRANARFVSVLQSQLKCYQNNQLYYDPELAPK